MHAIKPHLITGLCALALLACPTKASAAAQSDCAVLATAAASDLAVDDPESFERLTQACKSRRSAPAAMLAQPQGKPTPNAARSSQRNAPQRVADTPVQAGEKGGCPYRFYPVEGYKHPQGTEACIGGRTHICRKTSKGVVDWDLVEGSSCTGENVRDIKAYEYNHRESVLMNEKTSKE